MGWVPKTKYFFLFCSTSIPSLGLAEIEHIRISEKVKLHARSGVQGIGRVRGPQKSEMISLTRICQNFN